VAKLMTRPTAAPHDLPEAVAAIREAAVGALAEVVAATGEPAAPAPLLVADRNGMVDGASQVFSNILTGLGVTDSSTAGWGVIALAAPVLSFVSCRVLGMYDPWGADPRLVLSAPNILQAAAAIGDDRRFVTDLVCLHEQTHRVQHVVAPWLPNYLFRLVYEARHRCSDDCEDVKACAQRRTNAVPRITGAIGVIEGYAQMVSEDLMRGRYDAFAARKQAMKSSGVPIGRWTSRTLFWAVPWLRSTVAQARAGEEFCRVIVNAAGMDILNEVWFGPEIMPTAQELSAPRQWWARV
jgi:uncharacterized protein (DUF2342 family)